MSAANYKMPFSISVAGMGTISDTVPLTITRGSQNHQTVRLQEKKPSDYGRDSAEEPGAS